MWHSHPRACVRQHNVHGKNMHNAQPYTWSRTCTRALPRNKTPTRPHTQYQSTRCACGCAAPATSQQGAALHTRTPLSAYPADYPAQRMHARTPSPVQRLGGLVPLMIARERRAPTAAADGCTALAAALGTLPSGVVGMVRAAVAALGSADV